MVQSLINACDSIFVVFMFIYFEFGIEGIVQAHVAILRTPYPGQFWLRYTILGSIHFPLHLTNPVMYVKHLDIRYPRFDIHR